MMTALQIIELLRDRVEELEQAETERAARYIDLNAGNADVKRERNIMASAYNAALLAVHYELSAVAKQVKAESAR